MICQLDGPQSRGVVYLLAQRGQHNTVCGSTAVRRAVGRDRNTINAKQRLKRNVEVRSHSSDTLFLV